MINITNKSNCSGCHACVSICPKNCISMERDDDGFLYPAAQKIHCINCGLCEKVCPILTPLQIEKKQENIVAYAAYTENEEILEHSSSGGIFTELATYIINKNGVVFGAGFDDEWNVVHKSVDAENNLYKLRGSKYVQSTIGNAYKEVKEYLNSGRFVLFTGTPCQIEGLYCYLQKDYENLITQDIICHGVPSPAVWTSYLKTRKNLNEISCISFRNKDYGWQKFSLAIQYKNGSVHSQTLNMDMYMRAFLRNLCLRPSCYECSFKSKIRQSDITLADFWGVENVIPKMFNSKGTSLILVNSKKGAEFIENVRHNLVLEKTDIDKALSFNSAAIHSVSRPHKRDEFIRCVNYRGFKFASKKYLSDGAFTKLKRGLKRIIKIIKN